MNELSRKIPVPTWRLKFDQQIRNSHDDAKSAGFTNTNLYSARARTIKQGLSECFKGHKSNILVDVGCNRGHFAHELARYATLTIGLDFASAAPQYCKENNRYTYQIEADGEHLPFSSESIAATIASSSAWPGSATGSAFGPQVTVNPHQATLTDGMTGHTAYGLAFKDVEVDILMVGFGGNGAGALGIP